MADEHPDIGSPTPEDHTTVEKRLAHSLSLLRATFDSTADGILVADGQGRIETFNQRFVQLWQLPADVLAGGDDNAALAFVLDQLIDPEGFLAKVNDLYANPDAESFDVLHFKDGRVFERYSRPQRMDVNTGTRLGMVSRAALTSRRRLGGRASIWPGRSS